MPKENITEYVIAGGAAAAVARTTIAPIERVKIVFQINSKRSGYLGIFRDIAKGEGVLSFWKGNGVAVVRVVPYLSVQLASNELYREWNSSLVSNTVLRNWMSGVMAGATSIVSTYPLDTVRARLAVQMTRGNTQDTIVGMMRKIAQTEGASALYRGCYMSCVGGGLYSGIKFATYDHIKSAVCDFFELKNDTELTVLQRAFSGAAGGFVAQTLIYPSDVIRRRMQTTQGPPPYKGIVDGITTIARTEGIRTGLFRGLSLNYLKTLPNVAIYLSLYDVFKYWLLKLA